MRYITATSCDYGGDLYEYTATPVTYEEFGGVWLNLFDAVLSAAVSSLVSGNALGSILLLLGGVTVEEYLEDNTMYLGTDSLMIIGVTVWTLDCTQIWDLEDNEWKTSQISYYAKSSAFATGYLYDSETHSTQRIVGEESFCTTYSQKFSNYDQRKVDAVHHYETGIPPSYDRTGDIHFYLMDATCTINYCGDGNPLFTHTDWT